MNWFDRHLGSVVLALAAVLVVTVADSRTSPIRLLGGDAVYPRIVSAGERIAVTRNYEVLRTTPATVARSLRTADCEKNCTAIELGEGRIALVEGEHHFNTTKPHVIPDHTPAGVYELHFDITSYDLLGRPVLTRLPVLRIDVVR